MPDVTKSSIYTPQKSDKVAGFLVGSTSVTNSGSATVPIAHGLPFTPLAYTKWSFTPDFLIAYEENFNPTLALPAGGVYVGTDGTNATVHLFNFSGATATMYYRIMLFVPSTYVGELSPTEGNLDIATINTMVSSYPTIHTEGYESGGSAVTKTINHDLGYLPQVEIWEVISGVTRRVSDQYGYAPSVGARYINLTTTQLIMVSPSGDQVEGWHYKIYKDVL